MKPSLPRQSMAGEATRRLLTAAGITAFLVILLATSAASGFAAEKVIQVEVQHRDDPVVITKVAYGNSEVQAGLIVDSGNEANPTAVQPITPFQAASDWLQNTKLSLLNRTNKPIAELEIILTFPETGDGRSLSSPIRTYHLHLGRLPENAVFSGRTGQPLPPDLSKKPMSFLPGQTLTLNLGDYIDEVKANIVDRMPFESVTKCEILRGSIFFEDGMRWYVGRYSVPDPGQPGRRRDMEADYFPGRATWPPLYGTPGHTGAPKK